MKNKDKPAYPVTLDESIGETFDGMANHNGLTKREKFAMAAMQGLLASESDNHWYKVGELAKESVKRADALLNELQKDN